MSQIYYSLGINTLCPRYVIQVVRYVIFPPSLTHYSLTLLNAGLMIISAIPYVLDVLTVTS